MIASKSMSKIDAPAAQPMANAAVPRLVAGFGRSGTTWVQDVLASSNLLRPVFEPLHPQHVRGAERHAHRYLAQTDEDPDLRLFLHRFFFEDFHSLWTDYRIVPARLYPRLETFTSLHRLRRYAANGARAKGNILRYGLQRRRQQRLIKCIRANMMLGWIKQNFDARMIFIVRHPAPVVLSQAKTFQAWKPGLTIERYRQDKNLLAILDRNTLKLLFENLTEVEAVTLSWCIENTTAFRQAQLYGIPVVHYEVLVQKGLPEWKRILSALELTVSPDHDLVAQPSQQTWGGKARDATLVRQYSRWMQEIDPATASKIQRILELTGVTSYRIDKALPIGLA